MAIDEELEGNHKAAKKALEAVDQALDYLDALTVALLGLAGGPLPASDVDAADDLAGQLQTVLLTLGRSARKGLAEQERLVAQETRQQMAPSCDVPWPVCPSCLGEPLWESAGVYRCANCDGSWPRPGRYRCPGLAMIAVRDKTGDERRMCRSHGVRASLIPGAVVEGLTPAELAYAAGLPARDEANRRDLLERLTDLTERLAQPDRPPQTAGVPHVR